MTKLKIKILHDKPIYDIDSKRIPFRDAIYVSYSGGRLIYITRWKDDKFCWQIYCRNVLTSTVESLEHNVGWLKVTPSELYDFIIKYDPESTEFVMFHPEIFQGRYGA